MREIVSTQRMKIDILGNKIESLTHQLDRVRQYQTEHVQHVDSLYIKFEFISLTTYNLFHSLFFRSEINLYSFGI